jgi:hypothetical protein
MIPRSTLHERKILNSFSHCCSIRSAKQASLHWSQLHFVASTLAVGCACSHPRRSASLISTSKQTTPLHPSHSQHTCTLGMPITFGSVGDIIAVGQLVKEVLDALSSSRGAAVQYQESKQELFGLSRALLEAELQFREYQHTPSLQGTCSAAYQCVASCRRSLENFRQKITPYDKALCSASTSNALQKATRKVQWSLTAKEDAGNFRHEVLQHTSILNIHLNTMKL